KSPTGIRRPSYARHQRVMTTSVAVPSPAAGEAAAAPGADVSLPGPVTLGGVIRRRAAVVRTPVVAVNLRVPNKGIARLARANGLPRTAAVLPRRARC